MTFSQCLPCLPCSPRRRFAIGLRARHPIALAALLALSAAPLSANAVYYVWTGGAGNSWSSPGSWQGNNAPPADGLTSAELEFGVSSAVFPDITGARSILSLRFNPGASLYTFSGGPLTLGAGGITHNAANAQGFSTAEVVLGADQTWTLANNAGSLSFGSGINTSGGGTARALTINAASTTGSGNVISGVIKGSGSLTKTGVGVLTLTGSSPNTYTGGTTFATGVLNVGSAGALGSTGTLTFINGTLQYSAANQTDYSARFSTAANQRFRIDTNGQNITLASGLSSSGGVLIKTGAGTLTLTGASTYSGATVVNAGTLAISGSVSTDLGNVTVDGTAADMATVNLGGSGSSLSTGYATVGDGGSGTFNQSGGSFTTNLSQLFLGVGTGSSGTYNLSGSGGRLSTGPAFVGGRGSGTFNQGGGSFTTNGASLTLGFYPGGNGIYNLSGGSLVTGRTQVSYDANTGVLTQSGGTHTTGTLGLTGYSTSSRGTYNLDGGVLTTGTVTSGYAGVSGNSSFNFNGGTLQASGASASFLQSLTTANVRAGGARIDSNGFDVTVAQNLQHDATSGAPAVDGGLTKLGAGTLTLTGANTYSGGTTFAAGALNVGSAAALGSTGTLAFAGGTLQYSAANQTDYSARFSAAAGQLYSIDTNGQNVTLAAGLTSAGGSLTKSGAGTLTLTGASTYTGTTTVTAGILAISGSLNQGSASLISVDGTAADMARVSLGGSASSVSTGFAVVGLAGSGTFNQSGGSFTTNGYVLYLGYNAGGSGSYNLSGGSLSTGDTAVGKEGSGSFSQSGGSVTTNGNRLFIALEAGSSGSYTQSGGSLTTGRTQVSDNASTGVFTQSGGTHTTGTLSLTGFSAASQGRYNLDGGTLVAANVTSGDNGTSGTSTFNFNGGALRASVASASFVQGLTTANVQAGGARIDTAGFNVTVAQSLLHDTTAGAAAIDGGLTKLGAGTLTLTGTNTFTGGLLLNAGTLAVAAESSLGGGGTVSVGGGGTLLFTGSATLARTYNLGVSTLTAGSGNTLTLGSGASINGGFLNGPGTMMLGSGATLNGVTAFAGATLTQASGAATVNGSTIRGQLSQTGGTLAVNNAFVSGSGRLNVGGTLNTMGTEIQGVTTITSGGTLANSGSGLYLTGGSRTTVNSGGTLSAATGSTIELNGSQLVNNGSQRGALDINFGSLAKGSGSFGTINVADGGKFSPGNSPGTATVENITFGAGGRYDFELNTANPRFGIDSDLLIVTDTLFITAGTTPASVFTLAIDSLNQANQPAPLSDFDSSRAYHFLVVDANNVSGYANARFNVDTSGFLNNLNGGRFSVSLSGNDLYLDFTPMPVPEPATWAMWLAAAAMGAGLQARRRRRSGG